MEGNQADTHLSADPPPPTDRPLPAEVGEVLGGYRLESLLGQGAMGCVYLGVHTLLGRKAAVKVLQTELTSDHAFVSRFFQEAKVVNEVRHPNIVDVVDFVNAEKPRRVAYIMEHIAGPTLGTALLQQRFSVLQAVNVTLQLARALEAVHALGVVHRDLKPANILVTGSLDGDLSEVPCVKIVDFGIAKVKSATGHQTATGMVLGTPAYMAPEQIAADPTSGKTDIYALGEIFFELVSGERAFRGENMDMFKAKLTGHSPLPKLGADVPKRAEILNLVLACLESDPHKRPEISAVIERLLAIASDLPTDQQPVARASGAVAHAATLSSFTQTPQLPPARTGVWIGVAVSALAISALVAGLLVSSWKSSAVESAPIPVPVVPAQSHAPIERAPPPVVEAPVVPPPTPPPTVAEPEAPAKTKHLKAGKKSKGPLKRVLPEW